MLLQVRCRACLLLVSLPMVFETAPAVRADELDELVQLQKQVLALKSAGQYRQAIPLAEQLVARGEKVFQAQPADLAICCNELALLYKYQGRYAEAEPLYLRALKIREQALGAEHPDVAQSLNNLGLLYVAQGRYAAAEPLYLRSLNVWEQALGAEHPDVAVGLNNLALLYAGQGRHAEAEPLYLRSLKIKEKSRGAGQPSFATGLDNLAASYKAQGRYAEAEPLYLRSLKIKEQALEAEHPAVALSLNNLALLYESQGRHAEAEPLCLRALKIREQVLGAEHPDVAQSLNNLALLYANQERHAEAVPYYLRALKIREQVLGPEHPDVAQSLDNLAFSYVALGRYAEAEPLCLRSLKMFEQTLGAEHRDVAVNLNNLALLYESQGRYAEAEPLSERAIAIWQKSGVAAGERFNGHALQSQILWNLDKKPAAIQALEQALSLAESQRAQASGGERERARLFATFSSAYERMVAWQRNLGDVGRAFAAVERSRARALLDQIAGAQVDHLAGVPKAEAEQLRVQETTAQRRVAELEKRLEAAQRRKEPVQALEQELVAARGAVAEAFAAIRNASPAYRQLVGRDFKPAGLAEVQDRIVGDDKLVLEYLVGDKAGYVFVIPPNKQSPRIELLTINEEQADLLGVKAGPLTKDVLRKILNRDDGEGVLDLLRDQSESAAAIKKLHVLWEVLIPEAERKALTGGELKQLIVIPDGALAMLPFDTLVVKHGEKLEYLLDVGPPIVSAASATLLLNLMDAAQVAGPKDLKPVLSVGDPAYDSGKKAETRGAADLISTASRYVSARGLLTRLPFSAQEVDWIADVFNEQGIQVGKLLGSEATERAVRLNLPGRKIVHLACHGLADQSYGNLFGALAFVPGSTGADDPADDGFLTLAEIYALDLKGCELTILSACDTNVGPEQKGEGTWALSRGFLVAGSRRVVASNWLVDDEAAASLMSYFCATIAAGQKSGTVDHAAALQQAKRWIRKQGRWETPYYWGTFALIGPK